MKKKILILLVIIVIIICGGFGYYYYLLSNQRGILEQEIINYTNKDLVEDEFVISVKTKGTYAYIEEVIKKYYRDLSSNIKEVNDYLMDSELDNLLSADNLESDGPKFVNSYKLINDTRKDLDKYMNKIKELCSEDYVKDLVKDKVHDKYYMDVYNGLMCTNKDIEELKDVRIEVEELYNNFNLLLNKTEEILKYLEGNKNSWYIDRDGRLYINDDSILAEYNKKNKELKDIKDKKLAKYKNRAISKGNSNSVVDA